MVASVSSSSSSSSLKDVTYGCGSCGYALHLSSSNRNTTTIDSKYGKLIKKGVVSFDSVDESRFAHRDEITCLPYFTSGRSCGLVGRRTQMRCRNCGTLVGSAYGDEECKRYDIKIGALQPTADGTGTQIQD